MLGAGYPSQRRESCIIANLPIYLIQVVFKEYSTPEAAVFYNREVNVFRCLGSQGHDHIVKYFGSFEQSGKCVVIEEYADGGTLSEFLQTSDRPSTPAELERLFDSLFDLCKAIHYLQKEWR